MKIKNYIILLLCAAFTMQSCTKEKDNLIDSTELGSITVKGVKNAIDVYTGGTFQLEVEPVPAEALGANDLVYTFSSSDEGIFTVDEEGLIEGIAVGEAYLQIGVEEFPDIVSAYLVRVADEIFLVEEIVLADEYKELKMPIQGDEIVNAISLLPGISFLPENAEDEDFTAISTQIDALPLLDNFTMNFNTANYRYLKVVIAAGTEDTSGSTMQIAELRVGKRN